MSTKFRVQGLAETPTTNVEITAAPSGPGNSLMALVDLADATEDTAGFARFPLTLDGSSEKTNKGVRRVMVRATVKVPASDIGAYSAGNVNVITGAQVASRSRDITCHAVLTVPKGIEFAVEGSVSGTFIAEKAVQLVISSVCAMLGNKNGLENTNLLTDKLIALNSEAPIVRGLLGMWPLDPLAGDYGHALAV